MTIASEVRRNQETHVGLSWTVGSGKYKLTKVITLAPRFIVKNELSGRSICVREHGVAPRERSNLGPGERMPVFSLRTGYEKLLTVAFPGLNTQWRVSILFSLYTRAHCRCRSPPFSIEDIGDVYFRLKELGEHGTTHLVCADINMSGATIFVRLKSADDEWPFVIENDRCAWCYQAVLTI